MTYFNNIDTLEELRRIYKELLKIHHPDNGGNVEDMQNINTEYDRLFKVLKDKHESKQASTDGAKTDFNNYKYDFEVDEKLRSVLQKVIHFSDITIDIVGVFIWIDGNTYPYRNELKEIGFKWSGQRKKWYYHDGEYRKRGNKKMSYADIQNYYGSTEVQPEERKQLKQA